MPPAFEATAPPSLAEARAFCERLARSHYENFSVGSWLLPRDRRQDVFNLYAYCRSVDDIGDEGTGDRLAALDEWEKDLRRCYPGGDGPPRHPVFTALEATIASRDIPLEPFLKLIRANRMDQARKRHATFPDLLYYCDHSANPCGRLFLYVFGYRDAERQKLSDATCTALQLTNFWQDIAVDWGKGRVYIPQEDLARFAVTEDEIARGATTDRFRKLMAFETDRAREFFREGLKLVPLLEGRIRTDVSLFSRGGMALLDKIRKINYDIFRKRPALSKTEKMLLLFRALLNRSAP
ncbi:MAG: squalene synthase HpnC [Planctomycetota bacterium]